MYTSYVLWWFFMSYIESDPTKSDLRVTNIIFSRQCYRLFDRIHNKIVHNYRVDWNAYQRKYIYIAMRCLSYCDIQILANKWASIFAEMKCYRSCVVSIETFNLSLLTHSGKLYDGKENFLFLFFEKNNIIE